MSLSLVLANKLPISMLLIGSLLASASESDIYSIELKMGRVMKKPAFCICKNKETDQLRGSREADQRLCFRYSDCTISLISKSEISSL